VTFASVPEATAAVRAYFDTVNPSGGKRGHELQLIVRERRRLERRMGNSANQTFSVAKKLFRPLKYSYSLCPTLFR
jgi:hypothetical protein